MQMRGFSAHRRAPDHPVTVPIIARLKACHRLLPTASAVRNFVRVQEAVGSRVLQLDGASTCNLRTSGQAHCHQ
jgi:hypothetical protein